MLALPAQAQEPALWPGAKYDPAIPTIKSVLGHDHGEVITPPEGVAQYLQALQKAAPTRSRLIEYARTWEGRPLWLFVIGSPDRIAKLEQVKADLQRFGDPRRQQGGDAERLVKELPVVVWLIHGVHGNEISSADAALLEAYHLLAAQGDAGVDLVLRDALVLIDPMQNPDGRARFISTNLQGRAANADPAPYSAEHDEPWPGGRSNHYLFDMNRDWFAQSQPETRGRIKIGLEYLPQITVDLHEQGGDNAYYFSPPAEAINPHVTKSQIAAWELLGRANAARFDERGWAYYIREVYDAFYPGYGDSWPTFQGSIGNTYEQASARGLAFARSDGDTLTYRDGVMHHFNAAIVTAVTAARNRERFMRDYLEYRRSAIAEGEKGPVREYIIVPGQDLSRAELLARNLATQGIEVRRAEEPIKLASRTIPAGAFIVSNAQPSARMIRNLLDARTEQSAEFIKKQEERRKMRLNDQIYDITAWNLPMLFDVETATSPTAITVKTTMVPSQYDAPFPSRPLAASKVGYLMPWGSAAVGAVGRRHEAGHSHPQRGRRVHAQWPPLSDRHGVHPQQRESGRPHRPARGADRQARRRDGADRFHVGRRGHLARQQRRGALEGAEGAAGVGHAHAVAVGGMDALCARAALRGVADRRARQLAGPRQLQRLRRDRAAVRHLRRIDQRGLAGPHQGLAACRRHARHGGGGVAVGNGIQCRPAGYDDPPEGWSAGYSASGGGCTGGIGCIRCQSGASVPKPGDAFDYDKAIQPDRERPASQPGAILRVTLDTNHWLTAGHDADAQVMIEGNRVFAPIKLNSGRNVGVYATKDKLIASGLIWPDAQDILVQKAFLMHQPFGQGHVIAFAEEPNYRAFTEATMLLFMNAVLLGPGY